MKNFRKYFFYDKYKLGNTNMTPCTMVIYDTIFPGSRPSSVRVAVTVLSPRETEDRRLGNTNPFEISETRLLACQPASLPAIGENKERLLLSPLVNLGTLVRCTEPYRTLPRQGEVNGTPATTPARARRVLQGDDDQLVGVRL